MPSACDSARRPPRRRRTVPTRRATGYSTQLMFGDAHLGLPPVILIHVLTHRPTSSFGCPCPALPMARRRFTSRTRKRCRRAARSRRRGFTCAAKSRTFPTTATYAMRGGGMLAVGSVDTRSVFLGFHSGASLGDQMSWVPWFEAGDVLGSFFWLRVFLFILFFSIERHLVGIVPNRLFAAVCSAVSVRNRLCRLPAANPGHPSVAGGAVVAARLLVLVRVAQAGHPADCPPGPCWYGAVGCSAG